MAAAGRPVPSPHRRVSATPTKPLWLPAGPALACAEEDGGQGLPWVLEGVLYEWLAAAVYTAGPWRPACCTVLMNACATTAAMR